MGSIQRTRTVHGVATANMAKEDAKAKAAKAAKAVKKGGSKVKLLKKRFSPTFHRPKTFKAVRAPKYPRVSVPPMCKLDQFQVRTARLPGGAPTAFPQPRLGFHIS